MSTYVVTGSAGFIGKNIADRLRADGHIIMPCPTLEESDVFMRRTSLPGGWPGLREIAGIFHMGAISNTRCTDMRALMEHNVNCTDRIFQWCAWNKVPLVYASSAATYGDVTSNNGCRDLDLDPWELNPRNAYAWSKNEADIRVQRLADQADPPLFLGAGVAPPRWYGVKPFNVYGPGEQHKGEQASFIYKAITALRRGERVKLFNIKDQKASRDFIHVEDAIDAMIWLMQSQAKSGIYNIGTGETTRFVEACDAVIQAVHPGAELSDHNQLIDLPREIARGYQYFTQAEMSKLRAAGYTKPFRSLEEGIRDYVAWLESNASSTAPQRK